MHLKILIDGLRLDRMKDSVYFQFKIFSSKEISLKFLRCSSLLLPQEHITQDLLLPSLIDCIPLLQINAEILVSITFALLANWRVILVGNETTHIISSLFSLLSPLYFSHYIIYSNLDREMIMYLTCPIMYIAGMTEQVFELISKDFIEE